MSKKNLIISLVFLIVIAGGAGLYYLLSVEEEIGVIPPPIPNPVIQNTEMNTGGSELVSGEIGTNKIYNSFVVEGENVYWIDRNFPDTKNIIIGADAKTFELLNECKYEICYAKDKSRVFLLSEMMRVVGLEIIGEANPNTFRILAGSYSRDENSFFCNWNKISGIDMAAFRTIGYGFTDNKSVYFGCNKIEGIDDPKSLVFTENMNDGILQDQNFIYHIIPIGPEEFKVEKLPKNISFSPSQISEILTKIDENTKKQEELKKSATGVLVQGEYRAEYVGSKDNTDDTIRIINNGKSTNFPLQYNALNTKIKKNNGGDDTEKFLYFDNFSPSNHYLLYTVWVGGYGSYTKYLIDVENDKTMLEIKSALAGGIWTPDKKQFIYSSEGGGLMITKKGEFPKTENIGGNTIFNKIDLDEKFIYGIGFSDMSGTPKYLKIYDLNTLKEVYSQEIK